MNQIDEKLEKEPVILTTKDRKILSNLFDNARTPFSIIAKKVKLSKESVNYRVKRLVDLKFLVGFNTVIDIKKFGWEMYFVYVRFRNIDVEQENKIINFLVNHPNVAQLFKCIGDYDIIMKLFVKEHSDVDEIMKEIEEHFKDNFDQYDIDYIVEESAVPFSFLYETEKNKRIYYMEKGKPKKIPLSKTELKILRAISKNARMNLSDISKKLKISRDLIKYYFKKLEKKKIIIKYRPDTLPKRLGYNWYFLILKTAKLNEEINNTLEAFLLNHPNITYFYRTVRSSDIQVELRAKTNAKLNEILMQIRGILRKVLKRSELLIILDELKYTYFPECLLDTK